MKKLLHKLRGQVGESLAETLVAVLVIALAMTILAGMIGAAGNMVKTSEAKMNEYYESNRKLETFSEESGNATVNIMASGEAASTTENIESVTVGYVINRVFSDHPVVAYRLAESTG